MINKIISKFKNSKEDGDENSEENELEGGVDEEEKFENQSSNTLGVPSKDRKFRDMVAPTSFIEKENYVRSGSDYVETLFILNWPSEPGVLYLEKILYQLPISTDISIHVTPRKKDKALNELERDLEKAKAQSGQGVTAASQQARQKKLQTTNRVYQELSNTDANLFEIGMYITVRSENPDELKLAVETMVRELRTNRLMPEILRKRQKKGMQTVSPIGKDEIKYKQPAMSGAVGAMYPYSTTTVMEPGGIDYGVHAVNDSPFVINRFEGRENGYNQITAGKIGSGKTFGTLLEILRTKAAYGDDLIVFMLDPLDGFKPIVNLLGGKEVTVGGRVKLNPMRLTETPPEIVEQTPDLDPYGQKKQNVMDFFEMFFGLQNRELGDSRDILETAIDKSYRNKGIEKDIDTHHKQSPTITDLLDVLKDMSENPSDYAEIDSDKLIDDIEKHSSRLVLALNSFSEGGQYENLAKQTELNLDDEDIVYFNLSQQEGSGNLGLMMHLLLGDVYERAKDTDKKVLFCIDEAHYIMSDARSLDFLEQAVRHSRHYDLGINFITQTLEEFFAHNESEAIAQQCSIRRFHKLESGLTDDIKKMLNLNDAHVNFIKNAEAGSEEAGFSEALYGVDEHGYVPVRIYPSDFELEAIQSAGG
jgi:type IV secretory pathway VirB4 component